MIYKLKTSEKTMEIFQEIGASENLQPFVLVKLAIAASLRIENPLEEKDFNTDNKGLELNRNTITGEYDLLFKALVDDYENKQLLDDEYMSKYLKAHIDRGAKLIYSEFRYGGDFLLNLINEETGI